MLRAFLPVLELCPWLRELATSMVSVYPPFPFSPYSRCSMLVLGSWVVTSLLLCMTARGLSALCAPLRTEESRHSLVDSLGLRFLVFLLYSSVLSADCFRSFSPLFSLRRVWCGCCCHPAVSHS